MSRKKTSRGGYKPAGTDPDPSSDPSNQVAAELTAPEESKSEGAGATESFGDSLDALLLEAGARPPETASTKELGSRTLMGFGIEGLTPSVLRPSSETDPLPSDTGSTESSGDFPPTVEAKMLGGAATDSQVSTLLDEVAQALNVQASEYRDRARGKLPGITAAQGTPASAPAPHPAALASAAETAEFEDPDEPTSLTPGVISLAEGSVAEGSVAEGSVTEDIHLDAVVAASEEDDEAVVLGPASSNKSPAGGTESRAGKLPPIPGLSGPNLAAAAVPPHPGTRSTTPSGLSLSPSGRVRLPTPVPGTSSIPPPPSARLSLPPGMVSAPVIPNRSLSASSADLTATAASTLSALDSSRRVTAPRVTAISERVTLQGGGRVTQAVAHSTAAFMPAVLAAQVKIATVSLAGLIAVTFAGGLLVGMLVWRGQSRNEPVHAASIEPAVAPPVAIPARVAVPAAIPVAPIAIQPAGAGALKDSPAPAPHPVTARPAAAIAAGGVPAPAAPATIGAPTEAVVAPIAADTVPAATTPPPHRSVALRQPPRAKRPTTVVPTVADTAALFPKAAGAAAASGTKPVRAASETVATNAPAKPAPKSKSKAAWHDPFAD